MPKFTVYVNGFIGNIKHRFFGGSGEAEIYETDDPYEIDMLSSTSSAQEVYEPPPELIISQRLSNQGEVLKRMKWQELCKGPGKGIYKVGMNKVELIDLILAKEARILHESHRQYKAEQDAKKVRQDERARAENKSPEVVVGVRRAHAGD